MSGAVDVGDLRKEGYVLKESAILRQYRKRWLVLTRTHLYAFKKDHSYADPTEVVDLRACGTVKSADEITNKAHSFTVQVPDRNFYFACANEKERNEWVAAIGRATTESRRVRSYSEERAARELETERPAGAAGRDASSAAGGPSSPPAPLFGGLQARLAAWGAQPAPPAPPSAAAYSYGQVPGGPQPGSVLQPTATYQTGLLFAVPTPGPQALVPTAAAYQVPPSQPPPQPPLLSGLQGLAGLPPLQSQSGTPKY
ncbi:hypothetical protein T492DRAFT_994089 [Pavlovales sp. CCMP2436]|nr:hypothetical protein T492DRAFT_994089 [Pavlovales sp. CCMP2436]|mmetsp:Transcript_27672/g.69722  ORF Transcript_27672/g.69722 Transcript_27672/m.69722 type:complete len:256 (-) Transcript_27672:247-1014(-)